MSDSVGLRTYSRAESVVFRKTKELYGGLSNMASGFPLVINGINIWSSEALYQACRFPLRPDVQQTILAERSPMTAKMRSKPFRAEFTRPDWDHVKVRVMRWCLRVKLAQNWEKFATLLLSTDQKPIVEYSAKDVFWGARETEDGVLVGKNVLGRLLMELRRELIGPSPERLKSVSSPEIRDFLLLGEPIYSRADNPAIGGTETQNGMARSSPEQSKANIHGEAHPLSTDWPKVTKGGLTGSAGVHLVGLTVTNELGFIFREKAVSDIGIDGEVEIREDGKSHGRIIALQIKAGDSYLRERTQSGYIYRGPITQLRYWLNYAVPVLVILCDIEQPACWWQLVDLHRVKFHEKSGWSIEIPFSQRLDSSASEELHRIGDRFQKKDIVDLLFRNWLVESSYYELRLANILESPRDYHWISYLGQLRGQFIMADYVLADLARFERTTIDEMVQWAEFNHKQYKYDKLLLALISETCEAFRARYIPIVRESGLTIELVPLLLTVNGEPRLCEIGAGGRLITGYYQLRPWDDWGAEVEPERTIITASEPADSSSSELSMRHQG